MSKDEDLSHESGTAEYNESQRRPQLTIGIPTYNFQDGVSRILSRLEDLDELEIIVSEDRDAQNNNALRIPSQKNLRHFVNSPPLGAPANWNNIIQNSSGQYIWIIHHDEFPIFEFGLRHFMKKLATEQPDIMISYLICSQANQMRRFLRNDKIRKFFLKSPKAVLLQNFIGSPSNLIVNRKLIEPFDENLKWLVDNEWYFRLLKKSSNVSMSEFKIVSIKYENSITNSIAENLQSLNTDEIEYIAAKHNLSDKLRIGWHAKAWIAQAFKRFPYAA